MPAFQPTGDQFRAFRDDPYDGPIAQVNILKYRVKAEYQPGGRTTRNMAPTSRAASPTSAMRTPLVSRRRKSAASAWLWARWNATSSAMATGTR